MRIAHIITRMIVGGAQENTLLCCQDSVRMFGDETLLITGPVAGTRRGLAGAREHDLEFPVQLVPSLVRPIHPGQDLRCYRAAEVPAAANSTRTSCTRTAPRAACWAGWRPGRCGFPWSCTRCTGRPFIPIRTRRRASFFRWCERFAAKRCHHIVSVADAMTDQLVAARVAPREQFTTIYSGMEVEPFLHADEPRRATRAELGFDDDQIVVGKIARLFHLKGHTYVIEAAPPGAARCPQVRFLFVGDGILRESLGKPDRAGRTESLFPFHRPGPAGVAFPALIGAMDVLVHASLREGLARALPQALIAGKPVVSYDVDGAREVVRVRRNRLPAGAAQCRTAGRRADHAGREPRPAATTGSARVARDSRTSFDTRP